MRRKSAKHFLIAYQHYLPQKISPKSVSVFNISQRAKLCVPSEQYSPPGTAFCQRVNAIGLPSGGFEGFRADFRSAFALRDATR